MFFYLQDTHTGYNTMGLYKQYFRITQYTRNQLFGINSNARTSSTGQIPVQMLISQQFSHSKLNFYRWKCSKNNYLYTFTSNIPHNVTAVFYNTIYEIVRNIWRKVCKKSVGSWPWLIISKKLLNSCIT